MLEEKSSLSDRLSLEVHNFVAGADLAKQYGVDTIPGIVIKGDRDYGIRFFTVPACYELNVLIEDIMDVGKRDLGLSREVMAGLGKVDWPVHTEVFISPT